MSEYSLENISEKIHFTKTKEYFEEVLSSYQNKNYRSAVVMLWSVAICDIIYKLQHLIDLYDDGPAKEIISEITTLQTSDPKSPAWEVKLVDDAFSKTNLLDSPEYENLRYLQKQRHLSAHPILNQERELHSPNKETTRALIRNTLEGLLIKPPFYTQKILNEFLGDLSESKDALNTREKVKQYIESRYLKRLKPEMELSIYRSLWRFIFKLENEDCNTNRKVNFNALEVIGSRHAGRLEDLIKREQDYYSNIAAGGMTLVYLAYYLSRNPSLYNHLSDDAKLKIQHCIDTNEIGKTVGWFVKDSLNKHFEDILEWIEGKDHPTLNEEQWDILFSIEDSEEWQQNCCRLASAYYCCTRSFDGADTRFLAALEPRLHLFNIESFIFLLEKIERNDQNYGRGRASIDHPKIKNRIIELDKDFDLSRFPNFSRRLIDNE